jgi:predicted ABC-type exoprotein transport system permease subunit
VSLFLTLVIVAIVLGIIGAVAEGLAYLLVIGIVVLLGALVHLALHWRRSARRPTR